jgi:hypothetical protein
MELKPTDLILRACEGFQVTYGFERDGKLPAMQAMLAAGTSGVV